MEANEPVIHIKGLRGIIQKDLDKHKSLLQRATVEMLSYKQAVSYQIKKKKYYKSLLGKGKYDDNALKESMKMINVDIRQISDKVKLSKDSIDHHKVIVDTLSDQLVEYNKNSDLVEILKGNGINVTSN